MNPMNGPTRRLISTGFVAAALLLALAAEAAAPACCYAILSGTVYDTKTKLTWQQAPSVSAYTFPDARSYCSSLSLSGKGWRIPTLHELLTIVDYSIAAPGPAIDPAAFPNTPADIFWYALGAGGGGEVRGVDFTSGSTVNYGSTTTPQEFVRCVR
jgi:hypothetical protein